MGGKKLLKYLLRDEFTTALTAGNVNGTASEPGPGTRVIVDTASKLSINANGKLYINAVGRTSFGDPGIWYGEQTRAAGLRLFGKVNIATASTNNIFGFDVDQTGTAQAASIYFRSADIYVYENTENVAAIGLWAVDTEYNCLVVLRTAGAYFFIKGGLYTEWTLLWVGSKNAIATLYPSFNGRDANVLIDDVKIIDGAWLPTLLAYDSFTRTDGVLGSSELAGIDGQTTPVISWVTKTGTLAISTNKVVASALTADLAIATLTTSSSDVYAKLNTKRVTTGAGVVLRYVDADNYIYAGSFANNECTLIKRVAGTETTVITGAVTSILEPELVVKATGTGFTLFYNKIIVGATETISDAALQTSKLHGIYFKDTDSIVYDVAFYPMGTGGEYDSSET